MHQGLGLFGDGPADGSWAMSGIEHADAATEIDVGFSFSIGEGGTFGGHRIEGRGGVHGSRQDSVAALH